MKSPIVWLLLALAAGLGVAGGYWLGHRGAGGKETESAEDAGKGEAKPVASVAIVAARRGSISQKIVAYGSVVAPIGEVRVVSVPFEARVTRMLVTGGQYVTADQPLIEVEGSSATALALQEAINTAGAADRDLQLVKQRYDSKLATNTDLYAAENAQRTAQGRLAALQQAGAAGPRPLKAEVAGIISKVDVQLGQVVPIGGPLIELAAMNKVEVRLWAEPHDLPFLETGQAVRLQRVEDSPAEAVEGKIRLIGRSVDPATRMLDVRVSLPPDVHFLLETFISGQIVRSSPLALIVPRDAVLPGDDGAFVLFTLKDGHAVKRTVRVGIEGDQEVEILSEDVKEGDAVVSVGNFELEDGMAVESHAAPRQPASTAKESSSAALQSSQTQPAVTPPVDGPSPTPTKGAS